jgi:hypothetical protein
VKVACNFTAEDAGGSQRKSISATARSLALNPAPALALNPVPTLHLHLNPTRLFSCEAEGRRNRRNAEPLDRRPAKVRGTGRTSQIKFHPNTADDGGKAKSIAVHLRFESILWSLDRLVRIDYERRWREISSYSPQRAQCNAEEIRNWYRSQVHENFLVFLCAPRRSSAVEFLRFKKYLPQDAEKRGGNQYLLEIPGVQKTILNFLLRAPRRPLRSNCFTAKARKERGGVFH